MKLVICDLRLFGETPKRTRETRVLPGKQYCTKAK